MTVANVRDSLAALAGEFSSVNPAFLNESQTRLSFIDRFWKSLGWNLADTTEVMVETRAQNFHKPDIGLSAPATEPLSSLRRKSRLKN